ncbi:MAG: hypothetical protein IKD66_06405 [Solobacterium sp.]|nr:hypothetical protein [Solobacterium sp.]
MKRIGKEIAALLLAACLTACGMHSSYEEVKKEDGLMITAQNAGSAKESRTEIEVKKNEGLRIDSAVESGGIEVTVTGNASADPAFHQIFETKQQLEVPLEEGVYEIVCEVINIGTYGRLSIQKTVLEGNSEPAEEEESGQNPVMNFIGDYVNDRCFVHVEAKGKNNAEFRIHWSSSVSEYSDWTMSGPLDPDTLTVRYDNAVKKNITVKEDGSAESEKTVYENGKGSFRFEGGSLIWNDEEESPESEMRLGFAIVD